MSNLSDYTKFIVASLHLDDWKSVHSKEDAHANHILHTECDPGENFNCCRCGEPVGYPFVYEGAIYCCYHPACAIEVIKEQSADDPTGGGSIL